MTAPPIVLLPGHLGDERVYAPQVEALGLDVALVADHRSDPDLGAMADRLLAVAPPRFAAIGLSMGGMLALELIARAPERLLGAALLATDAGAARDKEIAWRDGVAAEIEAAGAPALRRFAAWFVGKFFDHSPAAAARFGPGLAEMCGSEAPEVYLSQAAALSGRRDRLKALAAFAATGRPIAIVCGAEDRLCPPALHRQMKQAAPMATLTVIENCGHLVTLEKPQIVSAALRHWLGELADAAAQSPKLLRP